MQSEADPGSPHSAPTPTTDSLDSEIFSECEPVYHPLFSSPEADIVLGSKSNTLFRVHSFTLKSTSGWFRTMFSLPQHPSSPSSSETKIILDETTETLTSLLLLISGLPLPPLTSYDVIEPIVYAAEKYDMPGPLSIIRALCMTPPFLSDPLRLYSMACRYSWSEEARSASTLSLSLNLHSPEHLPTLHTLSTSALLSLFTLHRTRRESLRTRLNQPPFVSDTGPASCSACGRAISYATWRELKYVMILEMDCRPLGDGILNAGLETWREAKACWDARCGGQECKRVLYDKAETVRVVRECIEQLPKCI
ncbi:hypothetical protein JAAARDRAFT_43071 [Jaapia argillacea MUCL 33604]|uniref:BTB domain-containing protein n=1 Tax=Jaapia argillacea MUCL 33604 TaxID=933084 RepID=A0A067PF96_9AGAM|nr:hypothetical protein JAAARDRAFT_43071 [Jaapia argillacea MUCL 33604]